MDGRIRTNTHTRFCAPQHITHRTSLIKKMNHPLSLVGLMVKELQWCPDVMELSGPGGIYTIIIQRNTHTHTHIHMRRLGSPETPRAAAPCQDITKLGWSRTPFLQMWMLPAWLSNKGLAGITRVPGGSGGGLSRPSGAWQNPPPTPPHPPPFYGPQAGQKFASHK